MSYTDKPAVIDRWRNYIKAYVDEGYPNLSFSLDDETIVPARYSSEPITLDFYFRDLKLAVDIADSFPDEEAYYQLDCKNGTERSASMYKEVACLKRGIRLLHLWQSDGLDRSLTRLDEAIDESLRRSRNQSSAKANSTSKGCAKIMGLSLCFGMATCGVVGGIALLMNGHPVYGLVVAGVTVMAAVRSYRDF